MAETIDAAALPARAASDATRRTLLARWFGRRRRFWVHVPVQLPLIAATLATILVLIALLALVLFLPPLIQLLASRKSGVIPEDAVDELLLLDARFWRAVAWAIPVAVLVMLRASHRIAGPLVRFGQVFDAVARGEVPRDVKLRRNDVLHAEARRVNAMLEALRARDARLDAAAAELSLRASSLGSDDPARAHLEAARAVLLAARHPA